LWPNVLVVLLALSGCSGRTIEGVWYGSMPFKDSGACRIRLQKGGRFDFSCDGPNRWTGTGTYRFENESLTLNFLGVLREKEVTSGPPLTAKVSGEGNKIRLTLEDGETFDWERRIE
jgi:hypothetical protein